MASGDRSTVGYLADLWRLDGVASLLAASLATAVPVTAAMHNVAPSPWAMDVGQLGVYQSSSTSDGESRTAADRTDRQQWPGGRAMACTWHDRSARKAGAINVPNHDFEADTAATAALGFASKAPSSWMANGSTIVVSNGIFRWGSGKGCYFLVLCPLSEKYGTFIARCNALIEKVSSFSHVGGQRAFCGASR
eukprot:SAG31_NODE_2447_length_5678_cov_5.028141_2_plen_193_part_00